MNIRKTSISFKCMVLSVGNYGSLLSLYSAFEITQFFQRQSQCLLSACWGSFPQTSFAVTGPLPTPPLSPEAKTALRVSCTSVSSAAKATSWLVLSLLGPPGYNHGLFVWTPCHVTGKNRPLQENAVDGPADLLLDACSLGNPLQTAHLTQCL